MTTGVEYVPGLEKNAEQEKNEWALWCCSKQHVFYTLTPQSNHACSVKALYFLLTHQCITPCAIHRLQTVARKHCENETVERIDVKAKVRSSQKTAWIYVYKSDCDEKLHFIKGKLSLCYIYRICQAFFSRMTGSLIMLQSKLMKRSESFTEIGISLLGGEQQHFPLQL